MAGHSMRILIIGGTRFIGPFVVRQLVDQGHDVYLFHRGETEAASHNTVTHIHGERQQLPSFASDFKAIGPDVVLDMFPYTEEDARGLMSVIKGVTRRVVAISSADVYRAYGRLLRMESGPADAVPLDENAPLRQALYPHRAHAEGPDDYKYQYEKILVERVVMSEPDLPGTILRLPAVYGPGDFQHRLFGYVKRMDDKRPFIVMGDRQAGWRWTRGYVENVAHGIVLAVTDDRAANRIYNVGHVDAFEEAQWIRAIGNVAGWDGEIVPLASHLLPEHLKSTSDYDHHLLIDTSRIRTDLKYAELIALEEGLRRTIEWERRNPPTEMFPAEMEYAAEDAAVERSGKDHGEGVKS